MNRARRFRRRTGSAGAASNQERDLVECYRLGVNSHIQKPAEQQKLQEVVRQFGMYWLMVNAMPPSTAFTDRSRGAQ